MLALFGLLWVNFSLFTGPIYETLDIAANSLLVQDAKRLELLTGTYSRFGFFHPGPTYLYVFATGEVAFHDILRWVRSPVAGQIIAASFLNAIWIGILAWMFIRTFSAVLVGVAATATFLAVTGLREPQYLTNLWFPFLNYLPFAVFTFAIGRLALGRLDWVGVMALSGGVLIHAHVSFVAVDVVMFVGALACWFAMTRSEPERWRVRLAREARSHRGQIGFGVVLAVIFLFPIVLHSVLDPPGEIPKYLAHRAVSNPWPAAWGYVSQFWGGAGPFYLLGGLVATAVLMFSGLTRGVAVGAFLATFVTLLYVKNAVDDLTRPYLGFHYFAIAALVAAAAVGWAVVQVKARRDAAATATLLFALTVAAWNLRPSYVWPSPLVPVITQHLLQAPAKPVILDLDPSRDWESLWGLVVGAAADWVRRGERVACIREAWQTLFTQRLRCTEEDVRAGTRMRVTAHPFVPSDSDGIVAIGDLRFISLEPRVSATGSTVRLTGEDPIEARRYLRAGFSLERNFTWSIGPSLLLDLALPSEKGIRLEFDVGAFIAAGSSEQSALVLINGRQVGTFEFSAARNNALRAVDIPAGLVGADGLARIELRLRAPKSPASIGLSDDPRPLGVQLRSVRVLDAD